MTEEEMKSLILGIHENVEHLRKSLMEQQLQIDNFKKIYAKTDKDVWEFLKKVNDVEGILKELLKSFGGWFFLNKEEFMKKSKAMQEICYNLMHKIGREPTVKHTDAVESIIHAVGKAMETTKTKEYVKLRDLVIWYYHLNRILNPTIAIEKVKKGIMEYLDENKLVQIRLDS